MEFAIKSQGLSARKVAALRLRALETDPEAFGELHAVAARRTPKQWAEWLRERANGIDRKLFVLVHRDGYVGMCGAGIVSEPERLGFIWGVYVQAEYRGQGGADLLVNAAHRWLAVRGSRRVVAKVAAPNDVAMRFYQRLGYQVLGQDGALREGSDIPVFRLSINLANPVPAAGARQLADPPRRRLAVSGGSRR